MADELDFGIEPEEEKEYETLIYLDSEGAHVASRSVAEKLEKKKLSASMITGLLGDTGCAARWLADNFAVREVVEEEPDNPARRGSLFHKVMEDLFALEPEERTQTKVKELAVQTLKSDEFKDMSKSRDVFEWLKSAINGYYNMGGNPEKVKVAEITMDENKGPQKGLEIFVKGRIGNSKREILGFIDRLVLNTVREDGSLIIEDWKGLALDTPLPTPAGWTTMGEVQVGDELLGANGKITKVLNKSDIHNRPCYQIEFMDGSKIVCDNVHLWNTTNKNGETTTLNTDEMYSRWRNSTNEEKPFYIKNTEPLELDEASLGSENAGTPYQFGEYIVSSSIHGLPKDSADPKIFVEQLLRSSIEQRIFLLQGMMQVSGKFNKDNTVSFATKDSYIKKTLIELLSSLGITAYSAQKNKTTVISFTPTTFNPFFVVSKHSAKVAKYLETQTELYETPNRHYIAKIEKVDSVPTQCVRVDSEDSLYLCGNAMIPTHNTGKVKKWKAHTKSDEGLAEQRQQLIYKMLLEQQGFKVSGARLIYPIAGEMVKVDMKDKELAERVVKDVEETDKALDVMIENNTFEYKPSFLCAWCPLAKLCPSSQVKPYKKMQDAYASQPEPEVLIKVIDVR